MMLLEFDGLFKDIEFVEADLNDVDSIVGVITGAQYIIHMASPKLKTLPKSVNDFIQPVVNATNAICKAATIAHIKTLVLISSTQAVIERKDYEDGKIFSGADFSDIDICDPIAQSKTMAE